MKRWRGWCGALLCLAAGTAYGVGCDGKIIQTGLFVNSAVVWAMLETQERAWFLCSLTEVYDNGGIQVQPEVCKSIYALLLTAKSSAQRVHFELMDSYTCEGRANWSPLPFYHMVLLQ